MQEEPFHTQILGNRSMKIETPQDQMPSALSVFKAIEAPSIEGNIKIDMEPPQTSF